MSRHSLVVMLCLTLLGARAGADEPDAVAAPAAEETTLSAELETIASGFAKKAPESMKRAFAQGIADVKATGILDKAAKKGDQASDAELLTTDGGKVRLSTLWAERPLVITFYRGGWCPYCNTQLRALERSVASIEGAGARLVAITPELPEKAAATADANQLSLTILTDKGNTLAKKMGIAFTLPDAILPIYKNRVGLENYNGDASYQLPLAATYVVDTKGVIRYAFIDADYKKRAEPADVVKAVESL